MDLSEGMDVL